MAAHSVASSEMRTVVCSAAPTVQQRVAQSVAWRVPHLAAYLAHRSVAQMEHCSAAVTAVSLVLWMAAQWVGYSVETMALLWAYHSAVGKVAQWVV